MSRAAIWSLIRLEDGLLSDSELNVVRSELVNIVAKWS